MHRPFLIIIGLVLGMVAFSSQNNCMSERLPADSNWHDMGQQCHQMIQAQIQMELRASITYLAMSTHFLHDKTHRPGLAQIFIESAKEEREHAKKLMKYLHMRGRDVSSSSISTLVPFGPSWGSMEKALETSVSMEKNVTESIKRIIGVCSGETKNLQADNDHHAADYLTGEFLTEQYEGIRKVVSYLTTLTRMRDQYGNMAEIIFDKSLRSEA